MALKNLAVVQMLNYPMKLNSLFLILVISELNSYFKICAQFNPKIQTFIRTPLICATKLEQDTNYDQT